MGSAQNHSDGKSSGNILCLQIAIPSLGDFLQNFQAIAGSGRFPGRFPGRCSGGGFTADRKEISLNPGPEQNLGGVWTGSDLQAQMALSRRLEKILHRSRGSIPIPWGSKSSVCSLIPLLRHRLSFSERIALTMGMPQYSHSFVSAIRPNRILHMEFGFSCKAVFMRINVLVYGHILCMFQTAVADLTGGNHVVKAQRILRMF